MIIFQIIFMLFTFLCGFMGIKNKENPIGIIIVLTVGIIQAIILYSQLKI